MDDNRPDELMAEVRNRLGLPDPNKRRSIRECAGVSTTEMARAIGCTRQALHYWEHGERTPSGHLLASYFNLLNALEIELEAAHKREGE